MNTTSEKPSISFTTFEEPVKSRFNQFWEKWGIWLAILAGLLVLFVFTDFGDFTRGMRNGYSNSGSRSTPSGGALFGGFIILLIGAALLISILSGIAHVYYTAFHRHVFKKNQLSYLVLYIVSLLLMWNFLSEGFYNVLEYFDNAEDKTRQSELNDVSASVIASILLIYMVLYGFITDFRRNSKVQLVLIQERTQAELNALKAQVNPHFLFNSLNNIYGTAILEESPRTAESIQQLSGIVRYVMEESRLQMTTIQRELRFINDYVDLQRIRLPNQSNIDIQTSIEWDEEPAQIAPLLLNPLIENAFKYGISIQSPCFVHIRLRVKNQQLDFAIENSILPRTGLEEGIGSGLANVRQRLALAYPDRHSLTVTEAHSVFHVSLSITL